MEKTVLLCEGKAKKVYLTTEPDAVLISYKNDASSYGGYKMGLDKGVVSNRCSNFFFRMLEKHGIPTQYIEEINDTESFVKKVQIIPVEVAVRNFAAGSLCKRLGLPEGMPLASTILEFTYKKGELGDPMLNDYHIYACDIATKEELDAIKKFSLEINDILRRFLKEIDMDLIDFRLTFGRHKGEIILADELSPETSRFWDSATRAKLDKDGFKRRIDGVDFDYRDALRFMGAN